MLRVWHAMITSENLIWVCDAWDEGGQRDYIPPDMQIVLSGVGEFHCSNAKKSVNSSQKRYQTEDERCLLANMLQSDSFWLQFYRTVWLRHLEQDLSFESSFKKGKNFEASIFSELGPTWDEILSFRYGIAI